MEELKRLCQTCNEEKYIIEIETDLQGETVKLSCGHRHISMIFTDTVTVTDQIKAKHKNALGELLEKYRTKIGGESGRPAKESIRIDREKGIIIHKIEEQNESGEWEVVHDEIKPFKEKEEKHKWIDWNSMLWRPKEGETIIRILPQKVGHKGSWYLNVSKHFVNTYKHLRPEVLVCNEKLFGEHCPLCKFESRMREEYGSKITRQFVSSTQQRAMNIIVRGSELEGVKVWEAPKSTLKDIADIYSINKNKPEAKQKMERHNVKEDAIFECDLKVFYEKTPELWKRYKVELDETRPLGTEKEKQEWLGQMLDLLPEVLYKQVEDSEISPLLDEVKGLMERVKQEAYFETPEYKAEMEAKRKKEEQEKEEQERQFEERKKKAEEINKKLLSGEMPFSEIWEQGLIWCLSMKALRHVIESGELAKELNNCSEEERRDWSDFFMEQFGGRKEWEDELREVLSLQLKELRKAKAKE